MISNAASTLADRLRSFASPSNQTPEKTRGFTSLQDLNSWRQHAEDSALVRSVDYLLQGMNAAGTNVDMFVSALPRWYAAVNFATIPWGSTTQGNGVRAACSEGDIALLEALGLVIQTGGGLHLGEEDRRSLADVLSEARNLVETDTGDMPSDVRNYLWSLIIRAEMIVRNLDDYGPEAVRQIVFELGGAMTAQAERAEAHQEPARAGRWRATASHLMVGFLGGAGSGAAGALGQAAEQVIKQIGG